MKPSPRRPVRWRFRCGESRSQRQRHFAWPSGRRHRRINTVKAVYKLIDRFARSMLAAELLEHAVVERLHAAHAALAPVYEAIARVRQDLPAAVTLVGFCGAPWTVATYLIAGRGTGTPPASGGRPHPGWRRRSRAASATAYRRRKRCWRRCGPAHARPCTGRYTLVTMSIGGGQGIAAIFERA
jgi:hypothetical protein